MSKIVFTREQAEQLSSNENVVRVGKTIVYSSAFKIKAVKLYNEEGLTSGEIFRQAGFDMDVIGKWKPKTRLKAWNDIYRTKGEAGLKTEVRGHSGRRGRPKTKSLNDAERIKYLEAQVAYLKKENDFLAKLRAKRAE